MSRTCESTYSSKDARAHLTNNLNRSLYSDNTNSTIIVVGSNQYRAKQLHQSMEEDRIEAQQQTCRRIGFQLGMFLITYFNYAVLHATRSAWSMATKDLTAIYGFSDGTVADMNATFLFCYSLGGIFLSHLGDKFRKPRLIFTMYTLISIVMVLLGSLMWVPADKQQDWLPVYFLVKATNGTLQSFAWAVNFGILCNWFPRKGRGILIGLWASNPNVGDIIGQQLYLAFTIDGRDADWGYTFYILAILVEVVAIINLCLVVEYPSTVNIRIKEKASVFNPADIDPDSAAQQQSMVEDNADIPEIPFWQAFLIFGLLQFAFSFFFIKFAMYGIYYWLPTYLQEQLGYSKEQTTSIMSLSSVGGICGSILMGLCSDLLFVRSPVHTIGCVIGAVCLSLITSVHDTSHSLGLTVLMTCFSMFEGGASIVIAVILCDLGKDEVLKRKRKAVSTISGINDGIAGFGGILGQLLLGPVQSWKGWTGAFIMFSAAAICACLPTIPYVYCEVANYCRQSAPDSKQKSKRLLHEQQSYSTEKFTEDF